MFPAYSSSREVMDMSIRTARHPLASLVALFGILATLLLSCQPTTTTDLAKDQTLKLAYTVSDPLALDPALLYNTPQTQIASLLFDGLVTIDRKAQIEPWGAESWTISPDGLTYTFKLRPHQRFSDGAPVAASDYARSINHALNGCALAFVRYDLTVIQGADTLSAARCAADQSPGHEMTLVGKSLVPDDSANTLTILLSRPAGYFLSALTTPLDFVVQRTLPRAPGFDQPTDDFVNALTTGATGQGGSGMFYLAHWQPVTHDDPGSLTLKPNPHWWGIAAGKKPHFRAVEITTTYAPFSYFLADKSLAFADTLVERIAPMSQDELRKQDYYHAVAAGISSGLVFNWQLAPFDDLNARKAFCLALNRSTINEQVFSGANIPTWHLVPQGLPGFNPALQGIDSAPTSGDVALAKQYWQRYLASHPGAAPTIVIPAQIVSSERAWTLLRLYQATWKQVFGVNVTLYTGDTIITLETAKREQLSRYTWAADYPDPQGFLSSVFASDAQFSAHTLLGVDVPAADNLMRQADALPNMAQRIPLYQQAEQLLIDNVAVCPLYQTVTQYALRPWVKGGFEEDGRGLFPNDAWVTGYIAKH